MYGTFSFNGTNSRSYSLISKSIQRPLFPVMNPRVLSIYDKSGTYDFGDNTYRNRIITMQIEYIGASLWDLRNKTRDLSRWLFTTSWASLVFDDEPTKQYKARVYEAVDFESLFLHGKAQVQFECQPFAFSASAISTATTITGTNTLDITNSGNMTLGFASPQAGQFDVTISGSWTSAITLALNGDSLTYSAGSTGDSTLVIDSINMTATLDGADAMATMGGDLSTFLTLATGTNTLTVTITGTCSFALTVTHLEQYY